MGTSKLKVLLFGMSGYSLSTVANMLVSGEFLDDPLSKTGDGMHGKTHTVESHEGRDYQVVTVGVGEETEIHWSDAIDRIIKSLKETPDMEYRHILFVMPARWFDELEDGIWKLFLKIFEGAEPSFGLIVTECRVPTRWQQENEKLLQKKYGEFILPGCYIYLDFQTIREEMVQFSVALWRFMRLDILGDSLHHLFERNNFQYFKPNYYDTATATDGSPEEMDPIDPVFPSEPIRKVLLFGKTGQGKSTVANMLVSGELLHDPVFQTGDGMRGVTNIVASHGGRGYHVVDTVGIGEETESQRKHATDLIYKFLKESQGEYSHILFVISAGRFDQLDDDISKIFPEIFQGAEPAFGVVVTKCSNPKKWQRENEEHLQKIYGKFILPGRYICLDFPPLNEDVKMEALLRNRRMTSLERLVTALQEFFHGNDFQYHKPEYATATDASLLSFARELCLACSISLNSRFSGTENCDNHVHD